MGITSSGRVAYSTLLLVRSPPPFPAPSATLRWIWRQRRAVAQAIPLETSQSVDSALTGAPKPPTHPTTTRRDTKLRASPTAALTSALGAQRWRTRLAAAKAVSPVTSRTSRPSSRLRSRSSTDGSSPTASPASVPRLPSPLPLSAWPKSRVALRYTRASSTSRSARGSSPGCNERALSKRRAVWVGTESRRAGALCVRGGVGAVDAGVCHRPEEVPGLRALLPGDCGCSEGPRRLCAGACSENGCALLLRRFTLEWLRISGPARCLA